MWKEIRGREQYVAVAQNQSRVSVGPELLCTLHDEAYGKIKQFQIRQEKAGQLDILVTTVRETDFGNVTKFFEQFFLDHYPGLFRVQVIHCKDTTHLTPGDKHLYFVQRLPSDELAKSPS
jgi:hypothetical protein